MFKKIKYAKKISTKQMHRDEVFLPHQPSPIVRGAQANWQSQVLIPYWNVKVEGGSSYFR